MEALRVLTAAASYVQISLLRGLGEPPTRLPEISALWDGNKEKTFQANSNSYPSIPIASERWIDSIEISNLPFSCCNSTPCKPFRQPLRIRTRCPSRTNACKEKEPFSRNSNWRSSICLDGTTETEPPKLTKPINPAVCNTFCHAVGD